MAFRPRKKCLRPWTIVLEQRATRGPRKRVQSGSSPWEREMTERRMLGRGVAGGIVIGLALGLMLALFVAMRPEVFAALVR